MRPERIAARTTVTERRPPTVAAPSRRPASSPSPSPALAMRQRLGNQGTQALIARSAAPTVASSSAPSVQCVTAVTSPNDPSEVEAHAVAARVMRMSAPEGAAVGHPRHGTVQRAPAGPGAPAPISVRTGGGVPLPPALRDFMEPRFGADFGKVRLHTDASAAAQSAQLNANAFALGQNVYFGAGKYQPDTPAGKELIAHELTHTIQQGAAPQTGAVRRSAATMVTARSGPRVQREMFGIPNPREYFAGKAAAIPGFTMLTVVIGFNPVTNARVERNAGNILRGAIDLIPGGFLISEALANHGVFDSVSAWASQQFQTLQNIGAGIWQDIENFIKDFSVLDLRNPGALWERAKAIVTRPIDRVMAFAIALKDGIVKLIKDAILKPIAAFARTTSGYPLLCTIMGKDPITGESVPQDPVALLGGFMKFIGEEEIWNNMLKANAIPRAFAWFNGALAALRGFLGEIPGLFVAAFKALEVVDILLIPRAFLKLAGVFGNFAGRFISWGAEAAWNLLEIIFDVVSPGALAYIKKTGAALKSILKNPLPFVGNLVKAAKLGFINFGGNFLTHLKAGLIDWLTGSLPGIYIPKAFSLGEIAKFAFSVLGLSWANIRQKLVKATSEPVVKAMETGFDIVVTLVRDGPAAAWEQIKEQLANLKDMVIGGITDFVVDMVVQKAIPKMIAMFIPGAGFISAILSIYDTVMVFVNKISKIIQVVTGFIDSIVNIAAGNIGAAATKVENTLAGLLSLAINFLAGFAGLGKVADKIMAVFAKVRAPIDKALDWLINWLVTTAKKLFSKLFGKDKDKDKDPAHTAKVKKGLAQIDALDASYAKDGVITEEIAKKVAAKVKADNPVFKSVTPVEGDDTWDYDYVASPRMRYIGGPKGGNPLQITSYTIKDKNKAELLEKARNTSGEEYQRGMKETVVRDVLVPQWSDKLGQPIQTVHSGQKEFNYPSRQDQPRLKAEKGHRAGKDPTRFPDLSMEVKKPGSSQLFEIVLVEITLVDDFAGSGDFAKHKIDQFTYTLKILKEKYKDHKDVPITYVFLAPRKASDETQKFILQTLISEGMPQVRVKWVEVKSKKGKKKK